MVRKQFGDTEIKAERGRVRRFTISTGAVDRDNDTINPRGWQLDAYRKNPVVLWAHDYGSLPLAKALDVRVDGDRLVSVAEFADHAMADTVLRLIDGEFLRATSVGFRPIRSARNAERGGTDFMEQELLEFSIVPVPANAEALRHLKAAGLVRTGDDLVLEIADDESVLELSEEDATVAAVRRDLAAQIRAATLAGLRARGFATADPAIDPAERRHVEDVMRATFREAINGIVRDAAKASIARARGHVD